MRLRELVAWDVVRSVLRIAIGARRARGIEQAKPKPKLRLRKFLGIHVVRVGLRPAIGARRARGF